MNKIIKLKKKMKNMVVILYTQMLIALTTTQCVFAATGTESLDAFQSFLCAWLIKIGGMIAMIGGVMFAIAWGRQDAEGKSNALLVIMGGFMAVGIGASPSIFGL